MLARQEQVGPQLGPGAGAMQRFDLLELLDDLLQRPVDRLRARQVASQRLLDDDTGVRCAARTAELGGDLYLINGAMTKLQDAGAFAGTTTEKEETPNGQNKNSKKPRQSAG